MKCLSNYTELPITEALEKYGAFFAFSQKQLNAQSKDNIDYKSCGGGICCPETNCKDLTDALCRVVQDGCKADMKENGKEAIIKRELENHECYYTGDITDCEEALSVYHDITNLDIQITFNRGYAEYDSRMDE